MKKFDYLKNSQNVTQRHNEQMLFEKWPPIDLLDIVAINLQFVKNSVKCVKNIVRTNVLLFSPDGEKSTSHGNSVLIKSFY